MRVLTLDFDVILDFRKVAKVIESSGVPFVQLPPLYHLTKSCTIIKMEINIGTIV